MTQVLRRLRVAQRAGGGAQQEPVRRAEPARVCTKQRVVGSSGLVMRGDSTSGPWVGCKYLVY